ncbi:hypothetical protein PoB_000522900 [Plakobranchus ocellatus]|uniref:Uncharacterized protein n=1 Tax=Plakobranchus ocellatus TaxID=259542 RepID=A0AAV3Y8Z8_9GAST|nr:hypothetical protein PoB_000522900 [Plakobranchus ocellatus]
MECDLAHCSTQNQLPYPSQAVYDFPRSNANLVRWGLKDDHICPQFQGKKHFRTRSQFLQNRSTPGATRQIIMVELTVPYERRMEEANTCKRGKYKGLSKKLEES